MNCKDVKDLLLDYIDGLLDSNSKDKVQEHCKNCEDCSKELKELQEAIHYLEDNSKDIKGHESFMNEIKSRETHKKIKGSRRKFTSGVLVATLLTLFVVTAFAIESFNVRDRWRSQSLKESESIEELLEKGYGQKLNLVAEDQNVRITLESVIADDVNTVLLVEIEDLKAEGKYGIGTRQGATTAKGKFNWSRHSSFREVIPKNESITQFNYLLYTEEKHITRQIVTLEPIAESEAVIDFTINELRKVNSKSYQALSKNYQPLSGSWNFQIPVTKYESYTYEINQEMRFDGNIIRFEKIEIAPTMTILTYRYDRHQNPDYIIDYIKGIEIIGNGKEYTHKTNRGGGSVDSNGFMREVATFDSMYFDNPKEIKFRVVGEYGVTIKAPGKLDIDLDKPFPQHFEYMGSPITVESVEIGEGESKIIITDDMKNRKYERLMIEPWVAVAPNETRFITRSINDGIFMDSKGNQYEVNSEDELIDMHFYIHYMENKDRIKYYVTSYDMLLIDIHEATEDNTPNKQEDALATKLWPIQIKGYTETKIVEEEIKVKLVK